MEFVLTRIADYNILFEQLISKLNQFKIVLVNGEMGAGKTTFISSLCKFLGSTDEISSPTFSIVNEYQSTHSKIYHFDFYRINSVDEALDIGVEEYFYSNELCLLEWSNKITPLLPSNCLCIDIKVNENQSRTISIYPANPDNIGFQAIN